MNILRVVYEWPPPWSGLTPGPFELTQAQSAQGHNLRVVCGGWPRHPVTAVPRVRVRRLPSSLPRLSLFPTTAPAALVWLMRWHNWADIIHGHGHLPVWYHLWRRAVRDRKPYVLHLHVTAAGRQVSTRKLDSQLDFWTARFEWPLHELSDRVGCQVADAVICTSQSVRDEAARHYGAQPEKLHVVPNGVNTELFVPEGNNARQRFGLSLDDKVMLFVGGLHSRKRPHLLLETLAATPPEWKLLLVGQGPLEAKLRLQAQQLGLTKRVFFAGYVPYLELPPLYRAADVFTLLSEYEGYPKVILEALSCGVPVVTTPSFQADETIEPHLTTLQEDAPGKVAAVVQRAAGGPPVDVARVRAACDWRVRTEVIWQIYQQVGQRQA